MARRSRRGQRTAASGPRPGEVAPPRDRLGGEKALSRFREHALTGEGAMAESRWQVHAHRGGRDEYDENALSAFPGNKPSLYAETH